MCPVKVLDCCVQGQCHSQGCKFQLILVSIISSESLNLLLPNPAMWRIIISQSVYCHVQKMGCSLQGQGHSNWVWVHIMKWQFLLHVLNWSCCDQLSLTVHVHNLECLLKRLLCCIQGQGHSGGSNQENVDRTLLLYWIFSLIKFISQWFKCMIVIYLFVLVMVYA